MWYDYPIGMITPLVWLPHWYDYPIGMITPLVWLPLWYDYPFGMITPLVWLPHWYDYPFGMITPMQVKYINMWEYLLLDTYNFTGKLHLCWDTYYTDTYDFTSIYGWCLIFDFCILSDLAKGHVSYPFGMITPLVWLPLWYDYPFGIIKLLLKKFLFFATATILNGG
jgi:hypothetical protein